MKRYKNILVPLDLSYIDETVIQYTNFLAKTMEAEKVYFLHNIRKDEIAKLLKDSGQFKDIEGLIEKEMTKNIEANFNDELCEYEVLTSDDSYTESLISYVAVKYSIDVVVLGNKLNQKGSGVIINKLSQMLSCDMITVPSGYTHSDRFLVATDFSKTSLRALSTAHILKEQTKGDLDGLHVYSIPARFAPYFATEKENERIQKHFEDKSAKFLAKHKVSYLDNMHIEASNADSTAKKINSFAKKNDFSMIVVSSKGRNLLSSLLIGSVTSSLLNKHAKVPLLVVKTS